MERLTEAQADHIMNTVIGLCQGPKEAESVACVFYTLTQRLKQIGVDKACYLELISGLWDLECTCDKKI